jgi:hypothetical protein
MLDLVSSRPGGGFLLDRRGMLFSNKVFVFLFCEKQQIYGSLMSSRPKRGFLLEDEGCSFQTECGLSSKMSRAAVILKPGELVTPLLVRRRMLI